MKILPILTYLKGNTLCFAAGIVTVKKFPILCLVRKVLVNLAGSTCRIFRKMTILLAARNVIEPQRVGAEE